MLTYADQGGPSLRIEAERQGVGEEIVDEIAKSSDMAAQRGGPELAAVLLCQDPSPLFLTGQDRTRESPQQVFGHRVLQIFVNDGGNPESHLRT